MDARERLSKIRTIEIAAARRVDSHLAGRYHSVFRGRGMAFSEVRPYHSGDDVRSIDWNVSARMSEPHVKLFTEERDRTVMLVVDMSASGMFGTRALAKRDVAAELAAVLALSAVANDDRVGLVLFTDRVERYVAPQKGRKHVLRIVRELLTENDFARGTDIRCALDFLRKVCKRQTVTFLLSDFQARGWGRTLRQVHKHHDVIPVVIEDPLERRIPPVGLLTVEDVETGERVEFDTSGPEGAGYIAKAEERRKEREALFRRLQMDFVHVQTDKPHIDALVDFFRARRGRRRK